MPSPDIASRLSALRKELKGRGLAGFVIPITDEHASEYVPDFAQRLAWISNFKGSAGTGVVMADKAAIFVDGRYTIQVRQQVDGDLYEYCHLIENPPLKWLKEHVKKGDKIGYDPFLHTIGWVNEGKKLLAAKGAELVPVDGNPLDAVWDDQPGEPKTEVVIQNLEFAGVSHQDKRAQIGKAIAEKDADAGVITQLDSIAWLFNIRARDVSHTPVSLAFAIVEANGNATLYIDGSKVNAALKSHLGNEVGIAEKSEFMDGIKALGKAGKRVLADPATANSAIFDALEKSGAKIVQGMDPVSIPKATKNDAELNGTRSAHIRDGAAVSKFLHWLSIEAPKGGLDEMAAEKKIREFRSVNGDLLDLSFDTISAAGPNGAICHYKLTPETNLPIEKNSVFLIDSGAQYIDGTTDITRTVAIGDPGEEAKDRFTRVLKGHIALATAKFPKGTTGTELDSFARRPLWEVGLDYDHGTGHGVGVHLAVHEGPGRISKALNPVALQPGMIYSNEPGYYKAGEYGIRIENLVIVREEKLSDEQEMMGFETITFAPIDKNMIVPDLLTEAEKGWFNSYHKDVWNKVSPLVDGPAKDWLKDATSPL